MTWLAFWFVLGVAGISFGSLGVCTDKGEYVVLGILCTVFGVVGLLHQAVSAIPVVVR